jgi:hypothetical protein
MTRGPEPFLDATHPARDCQQDFHFVLFDTIRSVYHTFLITMNRAPLPASHRRRWEDTPVSKESSISQSVNLFQLLAEATSHYDQQGRTPPKSPAQERKKIQYVVHLTLLGTSSYVI